MVILWFNIILGIITGIIVFIFRQEIVNIFNLTIEQKTILSNILILYTLYLPIGRLANTIFEIIRLKGKLNIYRNSLIVFYVCLIVLDSIAYFFNKNIIMLFIATIIAWIISIIYMLYKLQLKFEFPTSTTTKNVFKYGVPYSIERILSKIFLLLYGVLASKLGTEKYSIHTICYSVCLSLELITDAYQATLMIKVPEGKTYKEQYKKCMDMKNNILVIKKVLNQIIMNLKMFSLCKYKKDA